VAAVAAALALAPAPPTAEAATAVGSFTARIVIQAECQVVATSTLDFGTSGILIADVDQSTTFQVQCTSTTAYSVGLDAGTTAGGTTTTRRMTSGAATVDYAMFSDAARTINWGNAAGVDTVAGVGNGAAQTYTVYGRVPVQTAPAPNTYTDTVTITVTY
jgi:spore coat protein U-like protein